ncbi:MAG: hypothetical protein LC778_19910 [Acidobacteria bacterium]|nr:hypothetical protein [Acidobacteriota bacterium]
MNKRASLRTTFYFACVALLAASITSPASTQSRIDKSKDSQDTNTATTGAGCETVRDRFSNRTTVSMPERVIFRSNSPREELSLTVNLASGETAAANRRREIELVFISKSERYRYHEQAEVNFIVNGERVSGGVAYTLGAVPASPLVQEKMQLLLPVEKFLQIINGREVEMRMGQTEITIQRADLEALRRYASCAGLTNR